MRTKQSRKNATPFKNYSLEELARELYSLLTDNPTSYSSIGFIENNLNAFIDSRIFAQYEEIFHKISRTAIERLSLDDAIDRSYKIARGSYDRDPDFRGISFLANVLIDLEKTSYPQFLIDNLFGRHAMRPDNQKRDDQLETLFARYQKYSRGRKGVIDASVRRLFVKKVKVFYTIERYPLFAQALDQFRRLHSGQSNAFVLTKQLQRVLRAGADLIDDLATAIGILENDAGLSAHVRESYIANLTQQIIDIWELQKECGHNVTEATLGHPKAVEILNDYELSEIDGFRNGRHDGEIDAVADLINSIEELPEVVSRLYVLDYSAYTNVKDEIIANEENRIRQILKRIESRIISLAEDHEEAGQALDQSFKHIYTMISRKIRGSEQGSDNGLKRAFQEIDRDIALKSTEGLEKKESDAAGGYNTIAAQILRLSKELSAILGALPEYNDPQRPRIFRWGEYKPLGGGGQGAVEIGYDHRKNTFVALKAPIGQNVDQLLHEAEIHEPLMHPNILFCDGLYMETATTGTATDTEPAHLSEGGGEAKPHLVLEYFPGENWKWYLNKSLRAAAAGKTGTDANRMTLQDIYDLIVQQASAIEYLESKRLIHGDMKPENFMCIKGGGAEHLLSKLIDLGCAHREGAKTTLLRYSYGYMNPENFRLLSNDHPYFHKIYHKNADGEALRETAGRSDLFSFLEIVLESLRGYNPALKWEKYPGYLDVLDRYQKARTKKRRLQALRAHVGILAAYHRTFLAKPVLNRGIRLAQINLELAKAMTSKRGTEATEAFETIINNARRYNPLERSGPKAFAAEIKVYFRKFPELLKLVIPYPESVAVENGGPVEPTCSIFIDKTDDSIDIADESCTAPESTRGGQAGADEGTVTVELDARTGDIKSVTAEDGTREDYVSTPPPSDEGESITVDSVHGRKLGAGETTTARHYRGKSEKVPVKEIAKTHKGLLLHVRQKVLPKQLDEFARRDITISPGLIEFHTERLFNLYLKALNEARKDKGPGQKIKLATYFDPNGYLMVKKV